MPSKDKNKQENPTEKKTFKAIHEIELLQPETQQN